MIRSRHWSKDIRAKMQTHKPAFSESPRSAAAMAKMKPLMPKKMWYGIIVSRCAAFNCGNKNVAKPMNHWNLKGLLLVKSWNNNSVFDGAAFLPDTRTQWLPTVRPTSAANRNSELVAMPIHGNHRRPNQRTALVRKFRQTSWRAITLNCVCGRSGSRGTIEWLHRRKEKGSEMSISYSNALNSNFTYCFHKDRSFRLTSIADANWIECSASLTNSIRPNSQTPSWSSKWRLSARSIGGWCRSDWKSPTGRLPVVEPH